MAKLRRKVYITFPTNTVKDAIICDMYDKYKVRFNLRTASVNQEVGLIALELEGTMAEIDRVLDYLRQHGVRLGEGLGSSEQ